jgi:hypothetical protein
MSAKHSAIAAADGATLSTAYLPSKSTTHGKTELTANTTSKQPAKRSAI